MVRLISPEQQSALSLWIHLLRRRHLQISEVLVANFVPVQEHQAGRDAHGDRRPQHAAEVEKSQSIRRSAHRPADWSSRDSLGNLRAARGEATTRFVQLPGSRRHIWLHPGESLTPPWGHRRFGPWRYASHAAD